MEMVPEGLGAVVTWWLPGGYLVLWSGGYLVLWSGGYLVVTWWLPGGYLVVTWCCGAVVMEE